MEESNRLTYCIDFGKVQQLEEILQAHPDALNYKNELGHTWLHKASIHGKPAIAAHLVELGCDFRIKSKDGKKALDLAHHMGNDQIVILLTDVIKAISMSLQSEAEASTTASVSTSEDDLIQLLAEMLDSTD